MSNDNGKLYFHEFSCIAYMQYCAKGKKKSKGKVIEFFFIILCDKNEFLI